MRVLVIDDEKPLADTFALILRKEGYEVMAAYERPAALSQVESFLSDVVISDVVMAGMNGIKVSTQSSGRISNLSNYSF